MLSSLRVTYHNLDTSNLFRARNPTEGHYVRMHVFYGAYYYSGLVRHVSGLSAVSVSA